MLMTFLKKKQAKVAIVEVKLDEGIIRNNIPMEFHQRYYADSKNEIH